MSERLHQNQSPEAPDSYTAVLAKAEAWAQSLPEEDQAGMATMADLLGEFDKHQAWARKYQEDNPDFPDSEHDLDDAELSALGELRREHPSTDDVIWQQAFEDGRLLG